ncbi:MAG TPA: hypothetical protein VFX30_02790 [bacterium]|nr:hypothetical protein [bacterium]
MVPLLVQRLEADFLSGARLGWASTPFLSGGGRLAVGSLLDQGAPARAVGDRLLRSFLERKVELASEKFGADVVRASVYPAARVFAPLHSGQTPGSRQPVPSGDLLEIRLGEPAWRDGGFTVIDEMTSFLAAVLLPVGWFVHNGLPTAGEAADPMVLRILTVETLEAGLSHFFGERAARFCFVRGVIPPGDMKELHRLGYHGVGLPMGEVTAHEQTYEPADLALHDAWHGAHWSAHVSPWVRRAASRLYDVLEATLSLQDRKRAQGIMDVKLLDLLLEIGGLPKVISDLKKILPPGPFREVMQRWDP